MARIAEQIFIAQLAKMIENPSIKLWSMTTTIPKYEVEHLVSEDCTAAEGLEGPI